MYPALLYTSFFLLLKVNLSFFVGRMKKKKKVVVVQVTLAVFVVVLEFGFGFYAVMD